MINRILWIGLSLFSFFAAIQTSHARLIRIIHTNDLHAHLEPHLDSEFDMMSGGFAAVKGTIDSLKTQATAEGIESLVLDAGDFSEGSVFYLAEQGYQTFQIMTYMGFDAVVFGNHDWMLGQSKLENVMKKLPPDYPLLGANYRAAEGNPETQKRLAPFKELTRAGLKIGILGLTTDEILYSWIVRKVKNPFPIWDPLLTAQLYLPELRKRNDLVIALTHIGYDKDKSLVHGTTGIDVVVGGHSHDLLPQPVIAYDKKSRPVPIVQAGKHGEYVGELTIDFEPGQTAKVVSYRVIHVDQNAPVDSLIQQKVAEARQSLYRDYDQHWLSDPIGHSEVPIAVRGDGSAEWTTLLTDAMRSVPEAGYEADLAVDVPEFGGIRQLPGPISRENLFTLYPRLFGKSDVRFGWTIWRVKALGGLLEVALKLAVKFGYTFAVSGATFEVEKDTNGNSQLKNISVGGEKLKREKLYTMGIPEGVARGALGISRALATVLRNPKNTGIPIWIATELAVKRRGGVVRRRAPASTVQIVNPGGTQ